MKENVMPNIFRRGAVYYYRRKIPTDLIEHFSKKEIVRSLRTTKREEAKNIAAEHYVQDTNAFAEARRIATERNNSDLPMQPPQPERKNRANPWDGFSPSDVNSLAHRYYQRWINSLEKARLNGGETYRKRLEIIQSVLYDSDYMLANGEDWSENDPIWLSEPLWSHQAKSLAAKAILNNTPLPIVVTSTAQAPLKTSKPESKERTLLINCVDKWALENKPDIKTIKRTNVICSELIRIIDKEHIEDVDRRDAIKFKNHLVELGQNPRTINVKIDLVKAVFSYAQQSMIVEVNPFSNLRIRHGATEKPVRAFRVEELNKIFSSPIYTKGERPIAGRGEAAFWIPLIALYTGARLAEICQLTTDDVSEVSFVDQETTQQKKTWVIKISSDGGKRIKNINSNRRVPIHDRLVSLGFVEYVKTRESGQIFPSTKNGENISNAWGKWFGRYLRSTIDISDTKVVFHSFRHTFKHICRELGIPKEVHDAITGHVSSDAGDAYGDTEYPISPLKDAMSRFSVAGLVSITNE
jgi:integrase